jgi:hypothetical protein
VILSRTAEVSIVFDAMSVDEIGEYLAMLPGEDLTLSIILTEGTMLTGHYIRDHLPGRPILEAMDDRFSYRVIVPFQRIAGILEHATTGPLSVGPSPPNLLLGPAENAGLDVLTTEYFGLIDPGGEWRRPESILYGVDTLLYLDADAISVRSGGIRGIGGGFLASASVSWAPKLVNKAARLLKQNVVEVGSHCGEPRADFTMKGYVEFFDVTNVQPSRDEGPLLLLEGSTWIGAAIRSSGTRHRGEPWALWYFREDRMGLGSMNWERIGQPVRIYGDKQPVPQNTSLGTAQCFVKARVAGCFSADQ